MAILLTKAGRVELARSFHRDIKNANDYFHFVLAKTDSWEDEESPDIPLDSEKYLKEFRKNIMFSQSVSSADICHLVRRIDWVSETIYDAYDDAYSSEMPAYSNSATSLADSNFYVITDENKVYKCIDNNNNSQSTVKPTNTITVAVKESDNYIWKFLFQISSSDETKFLDAEHIPVRKFTTEPYGDVNGEIDSIDVPDGEGGSGYITAPNVVINGDGKNAAATATVVGGVVTSINVDDPGSGYSFAFITFTGGSGGEGATATVSLGDIDPLPALQQVVESSAILGTVDRIVVEASGGSYTAADTSVTITGDGTGAAAAVDISASGAITGIRVTNIGIGYTYANISFTQIAGTGTGASARAILSPIDGHGSNPVKELFSTTIGITTSLSDNANTDLMLDNDFRQVGLVKNFYNYAKTTIWFDSTATALFVINTDDATNYNEDDIITTDEGGEFRVIQTTEGDSSTFNVHLQVILPGITESSTLTNTTQEIINLSINSVTEPEINTSTGTVVYIENRPSISRTEDQVETIKALVNF